MDSRAHISQNNIGKEKLRGLPLFNFKDYCKAIVQCWEEQPHVQGAVAVWVSGEALTIAVKRREVKSKGEKERYKQSPSECRVPKNSKKKLKKSLPQWSMQRNRGKQQNGKD